MNYYHYYESSVGKLVIVHNDQGLKYLDLADRLEVKEGVFQPTELIQQTISQLTQYFNGTRQEFDLPLAPIGTTFQQQVWESIRTIPLGGTRSYKEIAMQLGNPNTARAVGMANNKNPILIVTPCHRVIGANGKLVGFAAGLEMKKYLLALEGVQNER